MPEERDRVGDPELECKRPQCVLERAASGDVEAEVGELAPGERERAQQDDVPLDRDQAPDAKEPEPLAVIRRRLRPGLDPVVDDLERLLVEAFDVGEVAREPPRDRDVHRRELADGAVGHGEPLALAELVEAVLRRDADGDAGRRAGGQAVDVGMDEVRVQDRGPRAREVAGEAAERDRVDVAPDRERVERHAALPKRAGEVPRTRLMLVEHQEADVPAALAQRRQERQQRGLRAGDARHLGHVED